MGILTYTLSPSAAITSASFSMVSKSSAKTSSDRGRSGISFIASFAKDKCENQMNTVLGVEDIDR